MHSCICIWMHLYCAKEVIPPKQRNTLTSTISYVRLLVVQILDVFVYLSFCICNTCNPCCVKSTISDCQMLVMAVLQLKMSDPAAILSPSQIRFTISSQNQSTISDVGLSVPSLPRLFGDWQKGREVIITKAE